MAAGDTRTYDCRHIEQYRLGTSYPAIVAVGLYAAGSSAIAWGLHPRH